MLTALKDQKTMYTAMKIVREREKKGICTASRSPQESKRTPGYLGAQTCSLKQPHVNTFYLLF